MVMKERFGGEEARDEGEEGFGDEESIQSK